MVFSKGVVILVSLRPAPTQQASTAADAEKTAPELILELQVGGAGVLGEQY